MCQWPEGLLTKQMDLVIQARTFGVSQYDLKVRLDAFKINADTRYRPSCSRSAHECVDSTIGLSPNFGSLSPVSTEYLVTVILSMGSLTCTSKMSLKVALILQRFP